MQLEDPLENPAIDYSSLSVTDERFRILVENQAELIWMSDADMAGIYFNRQWLTFTGQTLQQALHCDWTLGLHPDESEDCIETVTAKVNAREAFKMEFRLSRFDAEYRWMQYTAVPWFTLDGKFAGYNGSMIDITKRKQAEDAEEILQVRLREEQKFAAIGRLTSGMAHDFNNILGSIMGFTSLALTRFVQDKQGTLAEYLNEVYQAGERAKELVSKMRVTSQESGDGSKLD